MLMSHFFRRPRTLEKSDFRLDDEREMRRESASSQSNFRFGEQGFLGALLFLTCDTLKQKPIEWEGGVRGTGVLQ